jgi:hypothetical protein
MTWGGFSLVGWLLEWCDVKEQHSGDELTGRAGAGTDRIPVHAAAGDSTDVASDVQAREQRLRRMVAGQRRQLEHRISQVTDLRAQVAAQQAQLVALDEQLVALRTDPRIIENGRKAAAYDNILATRTMRALRALRRAARTVTGRVRSGD